MYIDERQFVTTSHRQLQLIERTWGAQETGKFSEKEDDTRRSLELIKASATSVQARGVFRAASLCEDVMARSGTHSLEKLDSALTALKHLINQYYHGLVEIDPGFDWQQSDVVETAEQSEDPIVVTELDLQNAHRQACDHLSSLLPLVRNPATEKALSSLMNGNPVGEMEPDFDEDKTVSFDAVMHPLNNLILSEARHCGKAVSISYAADFNRIARDQSAQISALLEVACLNIVANGVERSAGGGVSQISVTGQHKNENLHFAISWRGNELSETARQGTHFCKMLRDLTRYGGSFKFNSAVPADKGNSQLTLTLVWPMNAIRMVEIGVEDTDGFGDISALGRG